MIEETSKFLVSEISSPELQESYSNETATQWPYSSTANCPTGADMTLGETSTHRDVTPNKVTMLQGSTVTFGCFTDKHAEAPSVINTIALLHGPLIICKICSDWSIHQNLSCLFLSQLLSYCHMQAILWFFGMFNVPATSEKLLWKGGQTFQDPKWAQTFRGALLSLPTKGWQICEPR